MAGAGGGDGGVAGVVAHPAFTRTYGYTREEALGRLVRLDLAQNPETYLSIQPQLDNQGRVWITVGNRTTLPG